jgi:glutamate synthase (NADPH/NADH) small chain
VRDWSEFHHHMEEKHLRQQGARCMDCGVPFCHTGTLISGMASGCPINNVIPEWNDLVYRGLWHEALERLQHNLRNTGRVCPAPCSSCVLGSNRGHHQNIERDIESAEEGWVFPSRRPCRQESGGDRFGTGGTRGRASTGRDTVTVLSAMRPGC